MKTYSTQADLRAALKAMPINQLVARCVYYQLINGVTYKPNTRKRKGSADNVISVSIPGHDEGIGITGQLFDAAREKAVARTQLERKRDKSRADTLRSIEHNARRYRVATPATIALLRVADAINGEIVVDGTAVERELAAIDAVSGRRDSTPDTRTKRARGTETIQASRRRRDHAPLAATS